MLVLHEHRLWDWRPASLSTKPKCHRKKRTAPHESDFASLAHAWFQLHAVRQRWLRLVDRECIREPSEYENQSHQSAMLIIMNKCGNSVWVAKRVERKCGIYIYFRLVARTRVCSICMRSATVTPIAPATVASPAALPRWNRTYAVCASPASISQSAI